MTQISITGYFTEPGFDIRVSDSLLGLIGSTIETEILAKYNFSKIKSNELELFIDSQIETNERKVVQLSKTDRGKYFSFRFFLPYRLVVENEKVNTSLFISEFMECVRTILSQFDTIPNDLVDGIKKQLIAATKNKKKYEYVMSDDRKSFQKILNKVSTQVEDGELV